jgi:hypothetical protein
MELITESKHIDTIKEPWRRSNRYKALSQMLLTNQRLNKLAASCADFKAHGMLTGLFNLFGEYFYLDFADRVFWLSTDEKTGVAPAAPPPAANKDYDDEAAVAVAGPRIQACVNLAKTITHMHFLTYIYYRKITAT